MIREEAELPMEQYTNLDRARANAIRFNIQKFMDYNLLQEVEGQMTHQFTSQHTRTTV